MELEKIPGNRVLLIVFMIYQLFDSSKGTKIHVMFWAEIPIIERFLAGMYLF